MFEYRCFLFDKEIKIYNAPDKVILNNDGNVFEIARKLWNNNIWERNSGRYEFNYENFNVAQSIEDGIKMVPVDNIIYNYEVVKKTFLYSAPLVKGEGLYDVRKGVFFSVSPFISVGPFTIEDVTKPENEVIEMPDETEVSFQGVFVHQL